jgi:hypothetical protein
MTVISISMLVIALINVVLMAVVIAMLLRVKRLIDQAEGIATQHAVPLIERLNAVAEDVKNIADDARRVEQRVTALTSRMIDQVEPPVRALAAVVAGVRAGVGRLFEAGDRGRNGFVRAHMRKE